MPEIVQVVGFDNYTGKIPILKFTLILSAIIFFLFTKLLFEISMWHFLIAGIVIEAVMRDCNNSLLDSFFITKTNGHM